MSSNKIVLGIDPGTTVTGYGIIEKQDKQLRCIALGIIDLRKIDAPNEKLRVIFTKVVELIEKYKVTDFGIEAPFYGKNVQSMLKLGKSQGVAIAAALSKNLEVSEFSPRKVKIAVTGNGSATKEQVAVFLEKIFKQPIDTETADATDALAVAFCCLHQKPMVESNKSKAGSWKAFINQNPKRIV